LLYDLDEEREECRAGSGHQPKRVRWNSDRLEHRRRHLCSGLAEVDGDAAGAVVVVLELAGAVEAEERLGSEDLARLSRHVSGAVEGCGGCSTSVA
jgi:hypothetical protein